jgi:hypothetical protein
MDILETNAVLSSMGNESEKVQIVKKPRIGFKV